MSCGVGCRHGSDPGVLWLWCSPAPTAPIGPLAWEPPYASGMALKRQNINKCGLNYRKTSKSSSLPPQCPSQKVSKRAYLREQHSLVLVVIVWWWLEHHSPACKSLSSNPNPHIWCIVLRSLHHDCQGSNSHCGYY